MNLPNSGERQIIFLSSQFIQNDRFLWCLAGTGVLLAVLFILLLKAVSGRKRQHAEKESCAGPGHVTGDTAEMPAFQKICLEQYGFRVVEDITYIHTKDRIVPEEDGSTGWNG